MGLRCFLKVSGVLHCKTSGGKQFHIAGAEYENARLRKFACIVFVSYAQLVKLAKLQLNSG